MKTLDEKADDWVDRNEIPVDWTLDSIAIEAYKAGYKEANRWHKVEDGLPEFNVDVLCLADGELIIHRLYRMRVGLTSFKHRKVTKYQYMQGPKDEQ